MFQIEDFHLSTDGDDYYPALCRAQHWSALPPGRVQPKFSMGWTLIFQPKEYRFSRPIELVRCMHLLGNGGSDQPGTRFVFFNDTPGLVIHHGGSNTLTYQSPEYLDETNWKAHGSRGIPARMPLPAGDPERPVAEGSLIENIEFVGAHTPQTAPFPPYVNGQSFVPGQTHYALFFDRDWDRVSIQEVKRHGTFVDPFESTQKPDRRCHGIIAYGRFTLRNCVVSNFSGHGVYIYGNTVGSNADGWQINTVSARFNGNNGLHIFGSDAHLGLAQNFYAMHNRFWGIADLSYHGNQFSGGQASNNHYGGFLRPFQVQLPGDPHPVYSTVGMPLPGATLLRWFYGEDNDAVVHTPQKPFKPNYAGKFLQLNRFMSAFNVLEYCTLNNMMTGIVNGRLDTASSKPAVFIDSGYLDTGCNTLSLEGEFIPSFNTGIRVQDRISLMAFGGGQEKVWIRAMSRAEAAMPPGRSMPSTADPVNSLPEIIFFTDPVAGGYVGSVYCIVGKKQDGTPLWEHRKFGKIL